LEKIAVGAHALHALQASPSLIGSFIYVTFLQDGTNPDDNNLQYELQWTPLKNRQGAENPWLLPSDDFVGRAPTTASPVLSGQNADPGLVSVDKTTGAIQAFPQTPGNFTMWLLVRHTVIDDATTHGIVSKYDTMVVAKWDLTVQGKPTFALTSYDRDTDVDTTEYAVEKAPTLTCIVGSICRVARIINVLTENAYDDGQDNPFDAVTIKNAPLGFFIEASTGEILGSPNEATPVDQPTIASVYVVDASGAEAFVEIITITVIEPKVFSLNPTFAKSIQWDDVGLKESKGIGFVRDEKIQYAVGSTVEFPSQILARPNQDLFLNPADNDFGRIAYKRKLRTTAETGTLQKGDPGSWLVDTETGGMLAIITNKGEYTVQLLATDGAGVEVEVRSWSFEVVDRGQCLHINEALVGEECKSFQLVVANERTANTAEFTDPAAMAGNYYTVKTPYRFAPLVIDTALSNYSVGTQADVTYRITSNSIDRDDTDGFFLNAKNGEMLGSFDDFNATTETMTFNITLVAVDASGLRQDVETMIMHVRYEDVQVEVFGPNGSGCENGGKKKDTVPFDKHYTCECVGRYTGDNCETKSPEASFVESGMSSAAIGSGLGSVILLLLMGFGAMKYHAHWQSMKPVDFNAQLQKMVSMGLIEASQLQRDITPREIRRRDLTLGKVLGSGAFGEVYKAQLDESEVNNIPEYTVAAKTVKDASQSVEGTKALLAEASVMCQVGAHPNLVSMVGVVTRGDPLVLVISFAAGGSVQDVLKKQHASGEPLSIADKLQMAVEVARGMEHIAKNHFIHRDLAARNVLVAEGLCKIADFGLSRGGGGGSDDDDDTYTSSNGVFPVRWTAPEAMETMQFAPPTDVWSFGIVMIELLTDGEQPYYGTNNPDVMKLTMSGGRHPKPERCTDEIYKLLLECWDAEPAKRPTFTTLAARLKIMAKAAANVKRELRVSMNVKNRGAKVPHLKGAEESATAKEYLFHATLSYDRANIELVKKIRNRLQELGFKIWYDSPEHNQQKSSISAKAAVIENSEAFLYCMSNSYKDSEVCHAEANYAHQLKKPMIALMCEQEYTADGWLGFLLGTKLWYGVCYFKDKPEFNARIDEIANVLYQITSHKNTRKPIADPADGFVSDVAIDYANIYGTGDMLPNYESEAADGSRANSKKKASSIKRRPSMKKKNKFNVMLSYCWAQQDLIKRIRAYLDRMGFVVWFDIEQMKGSVTDAMAAAVENSEAIVYCMSQKYKESTNCHAEANYAHQKKRPMIPLLVDADYTPDGWLGFLLGANNPINFFGEIITDSSLFEGQMAELINVLVQFTTHSVEDPPDNTDDTYMTFNAADIIGHGQALPAESDILWEDPASEYLAIGEGLGGVVTHNPLFVGEDDEGFGIRSSTSTGGAASTRPKKTSKKKKKPKKTKQALAPPGN
jgi:serine/threonine protein kinase